VKIPPSKPRHYDHLNHAIKNQALFCFFYPFVTNVDKSDAAFEIGIRENDIILTVNGNKLENYIPFKKFEMIEQVKTVVYKHDTE